MVRPERAAEEEAAANIAGVMEVVQWRAERGVVADG